MKYAYILVAAFFAVTLSSCCSLCPSGTAACSPCRKTAQEPPCSQLKPVAAKPTASCGDGCSRDRCACASKPCACADSKPKTAPAVARPKAVEKTTPTVSKSKVKTEVVKPAPSPPVAPSPPAEVTVVDRTYYWEFSDPKKRKVLPPGSDPYAQGFLPNPQDKGWVKEREYRLPPGTPVPGVR